jgi:hypothetical protein
MADLASELQPFAAGLVAEHAPGAELLGACVGSRQKAFSGWMVAIAVTGDRLIIQRVGKRVPPMSADGPPLLLAAADIARAKAEGGGWGTEITAPLMDRAAVTLLLVTTAGEKVKLGLMRGEGRLLGKLGGGEIQARGVQALGEWFARNAPA